MDPNIVIILADALLYITVEINELPQCPNINLHLDIIRISLPSIILGFIHTPLEHTQQTHFIHIGKKTRLKWASKLITDI